MPFNGALAGANALAAVREAIGMYMGMRSDRMERERRDEADSRAARQLALQEQSHKLEQDQFEEQKLARERTQLQYLVSNFGGERIAPETSARFRQAGMGDALAPQQTIPARTHAMPVPGADSPMQTIAQRMPSVPTGDDIIKQPESERMRIAYYNAAARAAEGDANRASREGIAANQVSLGDRRIRTQQAIAQASLAMRKYGIDMGTMDRQRDLMLRAEQFSALLNDRDYDNFIASIRANPLAILQLSQGGGIPAPPPTYFEPPGIGAGGGGAAGTPTSDWEIVPPGGGR
jgi:hypothetical protein